MGFNFPQHTDETSNIIRISKTCLKHIYKQDFRYHKVSIVLTNLEDNNVEQFDMLGNKKKNNTKLMQSQDEINHKFGKDAIFHAAKGTKRKWDVERRYLPLYLKIFNKIILGSLATYYGKRVMKKLKWLQ